MSRSTIASMVSMRSTSVALSASPSRRRASRSWSSASRAAPITASRSASCDSSGSTSTPGQRRISPMRSVPAVGKVLATVVSSARIWPSRPSLSASVAPPVSVRCRLMRHSSLPRDSSAVSISRSAGSNARHSSGARNNRSRKRELTVRNSTETEAVLPLGSPCAFVSGAGGLPGHTLSCCGSLKCSREMARAGVGWPAAKASCIRRKGATMPAIVFFTSDRLAVTIPRQIRSRYL